MPVRDPLKLNKIKSNKVRFIQDNPSSRRKYVLFMLLDQEGLLQSIFSLSHEEMLEAKEMIFDPTSLLTLGREYIKEYLKDQREYELYEHYCLGLEFCKRQYDVVPMLDQDEEALIMRRMVQSAMMKGLVEKDISKQLNCIRTLSKEVKPVESIDVIDRVADILKDVRL